MVFIRTICLLIFFIVNILILPANADVKFDTVIVLGAGSDFGEKYKVHIFEKIRPLVQNLYLCELNSNPLSDNLVKNGLVDGVIKVKSYDEAQLSIEKYIKDYNLKPAAIVTYRDEWQELCSILSKKYNLQGYDLESVRNVRDKFRMLKLLQKDHLVQRSVKLGSLQEMTKTSLPFLVKTNSGMRSEWVRFIYTDSDLKKYIRDIKKNKVQGPFLIEDIVQGHEVDVDIVMYQGSLLYAQVSDNFPTYKPYALETGHLMPSLLEKSLQKKIIEHAFAAATKCGFTSGVFHIESMLTLDNRVELIEINPRVGGMYISMWHEEIYNADLIKSTLYIAAGINPKRFLPNIPPKFALAQICVTSNNQYLNPDIITNIKWQNHDKIVGNKEIFSALKWTKNNFSRNIALNGHVNIGEITVKSDNPILALKKLDNVLANNKSNICIGNNCFNASSMPLKALGITLGRYNIRQAQHRDTKGIVALLPFLTHNVQNLEAIHTIPRNIKVFVVEDKYYKNIVGTISLHFWDRMRFGVQRETCYIHDLVVHPEYRNLGLGTALLKHALSFAKENKIYKIELACAEDLNNFYLKQGFQNVGSHLVFYNNEP